jgi:hypothetical protein
MNGHKITNTKEALKFIFAGKSVVTFVNTNTGNRFTYKVKQAKDSNLFFVSVFGIVCLQNLYARRNNYTKVTSLMYNSYHTLILVST